MRWGLIPSWAKDISIGSKMFNARAETIQEKPSFRTAFARRRCLIPADGFYEWQKQEKGPSKPFRFQLKGEQPFAFAGLWELWRSPEGDELKSCTIITTEANSLVAQVHPRMPVILDTNTCWQWLEKPGSGEPAGDADAIPGRKNGELCCGEDAKRPGVMMKIQRKKWIPKVTWNHILGNHLSADIPRFRKLG